MKHTAVLVLIVAALALDASADEMQSGQNPFIMALGGTWRFAIDEEDIGVKDGWFNKQLKQTIDLPGTMSENGYGNYGSPGELGVEGWAGWREEVEWHPILKKDYRGAAWYQREITVPESWTGKHIQLFMERICWVSEVWVDGRKIGRQDSLVTPHLYNIGTLPPGKHLLSVRVDNRQLHYVGNNTHSYHEQAVTIYNGIVGRLELKASPQVYIVENRVFPDPETGECTFKIKLNNLSGKTISCDLVGSVAEATSRERIEVQPGLQTTSLRVKLDTKGIKLWDEFHPELYTAKLTLKSDTGEDVRRDTFGFRTIKTDGLQFRVNGKVVMMRGEASGAMFPLTGYSPMTKEAWKKVIGIYKSFGLNLMRCHAFTPPRAAFEAADELGFYIQPELPNGETAIHDEVGNVWREAEAFRILDTYGNHPSFVLYSNGNEAKTRKVDFLIELTNKARAHDPRRLYTMISNPAASGQSDGFDCDDFLVSHDSSGRRSQAGVRRMEQVINRQLPSTMPDYRTTFKRDVPYMAHEVGQWYVFPDLGTIDKYTGVLHPRNLLYFKEVMEKQGLLKQVPDFVDASGRLSLLLYKEEIERSLRTPRYGGFQLLSIQDYYGQGSAFVGHIDNFFEPKPYVTADAFRRFCGPEVPLARFEKYVWTNDETFKAKLELANYGPEALEGKTVNWTLKSDTRTLGSGSFNPKVIPQGGLFDIGELSCELKAQTTAARLKLLVEVKGTSIANDWNLWVYPATLAMPEPDNVIVTSTLTPEITGKLKAGARVVLLPEGVRTPYVTSMSTSFWSPMMFSNQKQTLGFLCRDNHPAFGDFPTDNHNDWQWFDLTRTASCWDLSSADSSYRPLVQGIDHPNKGKRLGLIYEGTVGKGSLLISLFDLTGDLSERPVARQLRYSLIKYAASAAFTPKAPLDLDRHIPARTLGFGMPASTLVTKDLVENVSASSEHENQWALYAVDNNPETIWRTRHDDTQTPHPHELMIKLKNITKVYGLIVAQRRDHEDGRIAKYQVYGSKDGKRWNLLKEGSMENTIEAQRLRFRRAVLQYIKLVALSEVNGKPFTSIAELDIDTQRKFP